MADQENTGGDAGTPARVAFDLMTYIIRNGHKRSSDSTVSVKDFALDLYAECLKAAKGRRGV